MEISDNHGVCVQSLRGSCLAAEPIHLHAAAVAETDCGRAKKEVKRVHVCRVDYGGLAINMVEGLQLILGVYTLRRKINHSINGLVSVSEE